MSRKRCGVFALVGEPNAGKSTLMNRVVGTGISVVTHKAQTTRFNVRGIRNHGEIQLVLIDTPGLFRARRVPDRSMVQDAWTAVWDSDASIFVVDARKGVTAGARMIVQGLAEKMESVQTRDSEEPRQMRVPGAALVINKVDLVKKPELLRLSAELNDLSEFSMTFMVSARSGSGVERLQDWLESVAPAGPWRFAKDQSSDLSPERFAAELTRKHILLHLHQELPYRLRVDPVSWDVLKDGSVRIEQLVSVKRAGHRGILLGPRGRTIRTIGSAARSELRKLLGIDAHLLLRVQVRPERNRESSVGRGTGREMAK